MSIEKELARFAKTDKFQKMVTEAGRKAIAAGKTFGKGQGSISISKMETIGEEVKQIFMQHIEEVVPSIYEDDLIVGDPVEVSPGMYEIPLSFVPEALVRYSLQPSYYSEVTNILALLTHGWDTGGKTVRGKWHGATITSWPKRDGESFMQDAANQAELENPGVRVELHDKYTDPYWWYDN